MKLQRLQRFLWHQLPKFLRLNHQEPSLRLRHPSPILGEGMGVRAKMKADWYQRSKGFTLIELLASIIISSIVLGSLLSFMVNMLNSEQKEQAKLTTDREIQTALDYIANDLQAAIYIYDADGVAAIKNQLPNFTATDLVPVLVFWKRTFLPKDYQVVSPNGITNRLGCLTRISNTDTCDERSYFVNSLVAYYLIKDGDENWSDAARIGRWEIRDGIRDPKNIQSYLINPDPGFQPFDLTSPGTLEDKMNAWQKHEFTAYDLGKNRIEILADFIDHSTEVPISINCTSVSSNAQQTPANYPGVNPLRIYSFYACVDSSRNFAQVYLRGNALARINQVVTYSDSLSAYFPSASVQVKSQAVLNK